MKNFKSIILFLSIISLAACEYLDVVPDNVATIEDAFVDRTSAERFLATCYSYLPNYADPWVNPGLGASDEVWFNQEMVDGSFNSALIARGLQNATDPHLNFWDGENRGKSLFVALRDCNIFLENINKPVDITDDERLRWAAEVKFLKAYYHFWLLKMYGPIPIIDENLPIYTNTEDVKVFRKPVDEIIDFIVNLVDESSLNLPDILESEVQEYGRITRPIALAIKARVLITAASPLFNGNTDFAAFKDNKGENLFSQTIDKTKWQKAAVAAKEAIDLCESLGMVLVNDYSTRTPISEEMERECILRTIFTERKSPEVIWGATHSTFGHRYQKLCVPLLVEVTSSNPVNQNYAPTLRMAELYYTNNGVPINEDKSFDYTNRFKLKTAASSETDYVRFGQQTVGLHYQREARFYANIAFDRGVYFLEPNYYSVKTRAGELATKRNQGQYSATGYFMKKFISPNCGINTSAFSAYYEFPFPVIRLADLYLLYAEALNESNDAPNADTYVYIDLVRERAGLNGVAESWTNHSSQPNKYKSKTGLREIIMQERLIELAFEGQRFWDLRRWKKAEEYHNKPIKGWNISGRDLEFYNINTIYFPRFEFRDYMWPIKESELIKNPNLVQNPGW